MDARRYYALDALRGVAMLLGIVVHPAMFYTAMSSDLVPLKDPRTSPVLDVVFLFIHSFRMPLFFLLSGFFAALLVERYGMKRAYWNRVLRVLVPFLIGLVTLLPPMGRLIFSFGVSVELGAKVLWSSKNPEHLLWAAAFLKQIGRSGPGHLWFLYYLMMLYLLVPVCAVFQRLIARRAWTSAFGRAAASAWLPVLLSVPTMAALWPYKGGTVEGYQFFEPHLPSLIYYGLFFVVGYLLHAFKAFLIAGQRHAVVYALAALPLFWLSLSPTHLDYEQKGADVSVHLAVVVLNGLVTWLLIYAFIGLFQRFLDRDSPWLAYLSQSSYWVYLVHLPIALLAVWYLVDAQLPALVKSLLASAFTTLVAFLSYHYLVRRTWISVLLNGRRFSLRWPWLAREPPACSTAMGASASPFKS